jgi:hypothetical protein
VVVVIDPEDFSRTEKLLVDRDGMTFAEAHAALASRVLQIDVGPDWSHMPGASATVLTAVNCATRAFRGGVRVRLKSDGPIERGWGRGLRLSEAVESFGGTMVSTHHFDYPTVALGDAKASVGKLVVYATWSRWSGGVVTDSSLRLDEQQGNSLSGALAGAIGVSEFFLNAFHGPVAGRRNAGISLWKPAMRWLDVNQRGPRPQYLPDALWLAGLGHLGQAYAWLLGLLPYPADSYPELLLQDVDVISPANLATSLLADHTDIGKRKTHVVRDRLVGVGFDARLVERRFDIHTRQQDDEPRIILSGFDNYAARRALGNAGFDQTVDAGLGSGHDRYQNILVRTFSGAFDSKTIYRDPKEGVHQPDLGSGYEREIADRIAAGGKEAELHCGILELAGKAVGVAFVGAVAAALVFAEVLRPLHGGPANDLIGVDLGCPDLAVATESASPPPTRVGFIQVS